MAHEADARSPSSPAAPPTPCLSLHPEKGRICCRGRLSFKRGRKAPWEREFSKRPGVQRRNLNRVLPPRGGGGGGVGMRGHWKTPSAHGGCGRWGRGGEGGRCPQEGWGHLLCLRKGIGRAGCGAPSVPATCGWRRKVAPEDCLKAPTFPELQHPWKSTTTSLSPTSLWIEEGYTV